MGNSLFGKHADSLYANNAATEREFHTEIDQVVESFSNESEIDSSNVFFYQHRAEVNLNELTLDKGVMSFDWGIIVEHENGDIEVSCPVNVVRKSYVNAPDEIAFSIGDYDPNAEALTHDQFIKLLIAELLRRITAKIS